MNIGEREQKLPMAMSSFCCARSEQQCWRSVEIYSREQMRRAKNYEGVSSTCTELGEKKDSV